MSENGELFPIQRVRKGRTSLEDAAAEIMEINSILGDAKGLEVSAHLSARPGSDYVEHPFGTRIRMTEAIRDELMARRAALVWILIEGVNGMGWMIKAEKLEKGR